MTDRPRLTPAIADVRRAVRDTWALAGLVSGDLLLIACSGGADSLALVGASVFEAERAGLELAVTVVDHGLQKGSAQVAENAASACRELGVTHVTVVRVQVDLAAGKGMEASARDVRYEALRNSQAKFNAKFVMLGHTLNDQAETVLLGLTRGSGPRSVAGMQGIDGIWLRPLLVIDRATTEQFCTDSRIDFWVDPHNSDSTYTRVRIRKNVLPVMEQELGPGVASALARTANLLRQDLDFLDQLAREQFESLSVGSATGLQLPVVQIEKLHPAILSRVIQLSLQVFETTFSKTHIDAVCELVGNWHGQKELSLPGVRVVRQDGVLVFKSSKTLKPGAC
jgi:tRNA(Ile)-lysidine synthase